MAVEWIDREGPPLQVGCPDFEVRVGRQIYSNGMLEGVKYCFRGIVEAVVGEDASVTIDGVERVFGTEEEREAVAAAGSVRPGSILLMPINSVHTISCDPN